MELAAEEQRDVLRAPELEDYGADHGQQAGLRRRAHDRAGVAQTISVNQMKRRQWQCSMRVFQPTVDDLLVLVKFFFR